MSHYLCCLIFFYCFCLQKYSDPPGNLEVQHTPGGGAAHSRGHVPAVILYSDLAGLDLEADTFLEDSILTDLLLSRLSGLLPALLGHEVGAGGLLLLHALLGGDLSAGLLLDLLADGLIDLDTDLLGFGLAYIPGLRDTLGLIDVVTSRLRQIGWLDLERRTIH